MNNMIQASVSDCIKTLTSLYGQIVENGSDFSQLKPFFLWGQPGIGKSSIVYHLKEYFETVHHKKVNLIDLRLYGYTEVDFKGVPFASQNHKHTEWLGPKMFDLSDDDQTIHLLFLDELLSARQSVQAVALQLVLDRKIDHVRFPKNTLMIAASNREQDGSYIHPMALNLANRFAHIEIVQDEQSWIDYAYSHQIDPRIIAYIQFHPTALHEKLEANRYVYCTPRSWEKLSHLIKPFERLDDLYLAICAVIGESQGMEFIHYCKDCDDIPSIKQILTGKAKIPSRHDGLYLVTTNLIYTIMKQEMNEKELYHCFSYIDRLPEDYILNIFLKTRKIISHQLAIQSLIPYQNSLIKVGKYIQ